MRKNTNKIKVFFAIFLMLVFIMSTFFMLTSTQYNISSYNEDCTTIKSQDFSYKDYSSIMKEEKNSLGHISVLDLRYNKPGFHLSPSYSKLEGEYNSTALVMNYINTSYMGSLQKASRNFKSQDYIQNDEILVKLNETIVVKYDQSFDPVDGLEGYIIYAPRLPIEEISDIYYNDTLISETDYSLVGDFIMFNYFAYENFAYTKEAFVMNIIYSYKINIASWQMNQIEINDLPLNESIYDFNPTYNYGFNLQCSAYNDNGPSSGTGFSKDIIVKLNVSLYDRESLSDYSLKLDNKLKANIDDYLDNDNNIIVNLTDNFRGNNTLFSLDFKTDFTIEFTNAVHTSWAIDRLISNNNNREKIYFPTVISGPEHYLFKFSFFESTLLMDYIQYASSLFGRIVDIIDVNDTENSPISQGIKITTPSLVIGENACPFSIFYNANKTIKLLITDNINLPVWDVNVKVYYYNSLFGTYVSNDKTLPNAPLIPNENGEIVLNKIPLGEYKIVILQNDVLIKEVLINITSLNEEIFYIHTDIFHFPTIILVFGSTSAGIFLFGFVFYNRKTKKRK